MLWYFDSRWAFIFHLLPLSYRIGIILDIVVLSKARDYRQRYMGYVLYCGVYYNALYFSVIHEKSRMDQGRFVGYSRWKIWSYISVLTDHITSNLLKAMSRKFYLVYSWTLCFILYCKILGRWCLKWNGVWSLVKFS